MTQPYSSPAIHEGGPSSGSPDLLASRFRSLFLIGRGGMGSVEVALEHGEGGFERIVALKRMLPEGHGNKQHVEMFLREARLATMLEHKNVVHAFAFGETRGGLFLAMEYVEGEALSRVLSRAFEREGRLAAPVVAYILAEICDGLHAAHELADESGTPLNVVHRDVSPHNIMVAYDGPVKLLDFGVAKMDAIDAGGRTKTGEVKGKTAYMSPEQAMGEAVDRRSDLFSVGAVLYECIAGRKMWGGGTDMEVLRKLALETPPTLAEVPGAPPELVVLHGRLVMRDPAHRPNTAGEVADALRAYIHASGTRPDAKVLRAVMERLFAPEMERRRRSLNDALQEVAPAEADELRASFAGATQLDVSPPFIETHSGVARGVPRKGGAARVAWVLAGVAVLGVGAAAGVSRWKARGADATASSGTIATATATTSPAPSTSPSAGASAGAGVGAGAGAGAGAGVTAGQGSGSKPVSGAAGNGRSGTKPRGKPKGDGKGKAQDTTLDVDTAPF